MWAVWNVMRSSLFIRWVLLKLSVVAENSREKDAPGSSQIISAMIYALGARGNTPFICKYSQGADSNL